jgi:hypothetical protein
MAALPDKVRALRVSVWPLKIEPLTRRSLTMAVVWLIIVNAFALVAFNRLNLAPDTAMDWMSAGTVRPVQPSWNIIELHNRWDAYWFLDIAQNGYYLRHEKEIANVVFLPLYPLLVRWLGPLAGGNLVLAGWMLSSVFLGLAVCQLTRLTQEFHPEIDPLMPAVFLLVFPAAFFLNAVYSESLFLFLSLSTVLCALRRNFILAAVCAALASATRVAGVFLSVFLMVEFVQANGWRALLTRRAWPLALAPAGALAFFVYHWIAFGDFFLYLKAQRLYGRDFEMEAADYAIRNSPNLVNTVYDLAVTAVAVLMGIIALKRLRISYGVYMLVSLGVALSSGTDLGIARYSLVLFPIYFIAASFRSSTGRSAWLLSSALLLALNIICFVNHYWAG